MRNKTKATSEITASDRQKLAAEALVREFDGEPMWCSIRTSFVEDLDSSGSTPLSRMISGKGGQGGSVRLKLYLSLLWATQPNAAEGLFVSETTQRRWAELLELRDPDNKGRERIGRALKWLEDENLIQRERRQGRESLIYLREDSGRDRNYTPPGRTYRELQAVDSRDPELKYHRYFKLPAAFWLDRKIAELDATAIAALLILLSALDFRGRTSRFAASDEPNWWSTSEWERRFHLSKETRYRGFNALSKPDVQIVEKSPYPVDPRDTGADPQRVRKRYALIDASLDGRALH